ncbi:MAG TPA: gamma-glutamyltransferase [Bacteroidales bacterium]|nr:gamma-glutamyltransferase [Bacteroidales bacterium]
MKKYLIHLLILLCLSGCSGKTGVENAGIIEGRGIEADSGMVVSAHPESSRIGVRILQKGGNAIDAAIATEFALAVCYPEAGNLGGGGFMLIRTSVGNTDLIDFREKAPLLSSRDMYLDKDGNVSEDTSTDTHLSTGVPGTVDGMILAHSKYGKLPFREVIQPAIDLAEKGFAVTKRQAASLNSNRKLFIERNVAGTAFVKDSLWKEGDILIQNDLAETLKRIRDFGRNGFYSGKTARLLIKEMKRGNGIIGENDLKEYKSVSRVPLSADYKGYKIITAAPPSGGGIILIQLLKMIEPYPVKEWGFHSALTIHLMVEAERRSFADRSEYLGDPDFVKIPFDRLTDTKYVNERMSSFNEKKASPSQSIKPGSPEGYTSEQTTHFSVVDADFNAVSVTTTLNNTFGNSIVVDSAGFILNDEMDDFSVKPGHPDMYGMTGGEANSIQPGKRMLSSMTPTIVEKSGKLFLVAGSPGGSTIPTSVFQVLVNVIDYGMNIQEAVDKGRFHHQWLPDYISYERDAIDSLTVGKLNDMGHVLKARNSIGQVNAVQILKDGRKSGGADRRSYNSSCGY